MPKEVMVSLPCHAQWRLRTCAERPPSSEVVISWKELRLVTHWRSTSVSALNHAAHLVLQYSMGLGRRTDGVSFTGKQRIRRG